jgi:hypothetical protein
LKLHARPGGRCFYFRHRRPVNAVTFETDFHELSPGTFLLEACVTRLEC